MANKILDEYKIRLQKNKISLVANTMTKCYKKLANKKNLIDKICMDPVTLDLYYIDYNGNEIDKSSLSAGEKQLMVISLLWSLALCSKKKLPVIIDTPLSRLDSAHRESLIKTYFPYASEQTIILSTDSEINQEYHDMMKDDIGDEFTLDYMMDIYKNVIGNADSRTHNFGEKARQIVENAREQVASILNVKKDEVFFTSGATESNNIALQGLREYAFATNKKHIITSTIEHKAILETAKSLEKQGFEVDYISPEHDGRILAEKVLERVRKDTLLVSIMHVNNETGIIQPIKEIGEELCNRDVLFHVDATQSFGKLVDELREVNYDMLSMSAHKIGGPQGIGALVLRKQRYKLPPIKPIMYGGQQEHGIRPGTLPVRILLSY